MMPTINVGPFVIPSAGLATIVGAWLLLTAVERAALRLRLNVPAVYGVAVAALAGGFVGARLTFVALHWQAYSENLLGIVWPLTGGFNLWGGLLVGAAAALFYGRAQGVDPAGALDALAPGVVIGLIAASLADFLAGPGYGTETTVLWGIDLFGVQRHPVQLYELLVGLLALGAWWLLARRREFAGQLFLVTVAVYGAGRLFVDAYRANAWLTAGGYHVLQILSLAAVLVSLLLLGLYADGRGSWERE